MSIPTSTTADQEERHAAGSNEETQRRGRVVLRSLPIMLLPVVLPTAVALTSWLLLRATGALPNAGERMKPGALQPFIAILVLVVFVSSVIVLVRLGRPGVSALALVGVWTLTTTVLILRAGVYGSAPAVFLIPICAAGLLIDGSASVSLAALGTVLVLSLGWLEAASMAPTTTTAGSVTTAMAFFTIGTWVAVFWTVAGLTSLMAGGLQRALERSRAQSLKLSQLSDQLQQRVDVTSAQLLQQEREAATLEERTRLAREIHDTLAQGLAGVVVQVGAAQQALRAAQRELAAIGPEAQSTADEPPLDSVSEHALTELSTSLDLAQQMARESLAEARLSVWNLRSPALGRGDLGDALRGLVSRPLPSGLSGSFEQRGQAVHLAAAAESALLRASQEAVVNAARHSKASEVRVLLEYLPREVRLTVADNGNGFGDLPSRMAESGPWSGFGLVGMRERVTALGGTLELRSDNGAEVVVAVPYRVEPAAQPGDGRQVRP
jgi:signal transduction histidine kinase